jgi:hypothetical protein
MDKAWEHMTADERSAAMFARWISPPGLEFESSEAEARYKERATLIKDAVQLKTPERVPAVVSAGFFPAYYAGYNIEEMLYDYDKLADAWRKFHRDFQPDAFSGLIAAVPGRCFDILDYKLYDWPGHGVASDRMYQTVEGEYVAADEYDALIDDPTGFFMHTYMPRIFEALEPLRKLPDLPTIQEMPMTGAALIPFGMPDVQEALNKLMAAGNEAVRWIQTVATVSAEMYAAGFPDFAGGIAKAPFDALGDTLRGTRGLMMDLYRRPEKVLAACERFAPLMIDMGVKSAKANGNPLVFIPLHKGADGFMSNEQFQKFYWPTLKQVIEGLVAEGLVPQLFAEGGYNERLELIRDVPEGKVIWWFDQTDMERAKEMLGDVACIAGNVPGALMAAGTPEEVKEYCKALIDTAGRDGGFILTNGVGVDHARAENVKAMVDFTKEYGVY